MTVFLSSSLTQASAASSSSSPPVAPRGSPQKKEDLCSNPSLQWAENWRSPRHFDLRHKVSKEASWLENKQQKPLWVDISRVPINLHDRDDNGSSPLQREQQQGKGHALSDDELLQTLCKQGQLDRALDVLSRMHTPPPTTTTYLSLLKACIKRKTLSHAKRVHAHLFQHTAELTGLLADYLVLTLAKCGAVEDARQISATLPHRTVFSWTAIISAYVDCGQGHEALKLYYSMLQDGVEPDNFTFVSLFKACGSICDLAQGKKLHADARAKGLASHVCVSNTLVSMYGKCGALEEAGCVFSALSQRTLVSWNAMLSAYVEQGKEHKTLKLYRQMQEEGMSPNQRTFVMSLQACGNLAEKEEALLFDGRSTKVMSLEIGQALHADARMKDFASDPLVGTALLCMYGKCGAIEEAQYVFHALSQHDIVAWTAMLSAYVEQGQGEKALQLYRQMHIECISPNQLTAALALEACATIAEKEEILGVEGISIILEIGKALHADVRAKDFASDACVGTALLSMYGKCGAIRQAEDVFCAMSYRDIVSWTAMLSAYIKQAQVEKAFLLYNLMQKECVTLDEVSLICILQACAETVSLEVCRQLHFIVISAGIDQIPCLAATLINTYGSCASMDDAQAVLDRLSEPGIVSWTACIAGHAGEVNSMACVHMFDGLKLAGIKPDELTFTSVLSACRHAGLLAKGLEYFESMNRDHDITPNMQHYGIMLDLLARVGDFKMVETILERILMLADLNICLCLLGACRTHGNVELAEWAFDHAVSMQPKQAAAYVLISNIYANVECESEMENSSK